MNVARWPRCIALSNSGVGADWTKRPEPLHVIAKRLLGLTDDLLPSFEKDRAELVQGLVIHDDSIPDGRLWTDPSCVHGHQTRGESGLTLQSQAIF